MSPQRSYLVLSTDIPNVELDVLICDRLDVEPYCGNCGDVLIQFELVQNGCTTLSTRASTAAEEINLTRLSGSIEAKHEQAHLPRPKKLAHDL